MPPRADRIKRPSIPERKFLCRPGGVAKPDDLTPLAENFPIRGTYTNASFTNTSVYIPKIIKYTDAYIAYPIHAVMRKLGNRFVSVEKSKFGQQTNEYEVRKKLQAGEDGWGRDINDVASVFYPEIPLLTS